MNFDDAVAEGWQTYWHPNGQKRLEIHCAGGVKQGEWTEWYPSGQPRAKGSYAAGKPDGRLTFWHEDGKIWSVRQYDQGVERETQGDLDVSGKPLAEDPSSVSNAR